jgi:hypothetical protein
MQAPEFQAPAAATPIASVPGADVRTPLAGFSQLYRGFGDRIMSAVDGHGVAVAMVCLTLVIFVIVSYVVYRFLVTSLQTATLLERPVHARNAAAAVDAAKIPSLDNGLEYAMSFWVYVDTLQSTNNLKQVLLLGSREACTVYCGMDKSSNALYFAIKLTSCTDTAMSADAAKASIAAYIQARSGSGRGDSVSDGNGGGANVGNNHLVVRVEYVPLQRWVNVVVVMNQDIVTLYLDGDIYSVASVTGNDGGGGKAAAVSAPTGGMLVGDTADGFYGFVSRVQFFNYATSVYHARMLYNAGPVSRGLLGYIGLPRYRLQWPVTGAEDGGTA